MVRGPTTLGIAVWVQMSSAYEGRLVEKLKLVLVRYTLMDAMNGQTEDGLIYGRLSQRCAHLCVDMQRMFHSETSWHTPWMQRICPAVERLASARPEQDHLHALHSASALGILPEAGAAIMNGGVA